MKLTKITATNFKGLSFTLDLTDITFLVGSNFAGKTARTDAVRLLLLGYLPELGKTPAATWKLASAREMIVEGTFDNGAKIRRRWFLKGDSVKSEEDVTSLDLAEEKVGQLAVMLNAEVYFALGATDRVKYVFANIPMTGQHTPNTVLNGVNFALQQAEVTPEEIANLMAKLTPSEDEERKSAQDFIADTLETTASIAKEAKTFAERMEKTAQGLAYLRTQDAPATNLEALDHERASIVSEIEALQASKATLSATYDVMEKTRKRREELLSAVKIKDVLAKRLASLAQNAIDKQTALEAGLSFTEEQVEAMWAKERESSLAIRDYGRDLREVEEAITSNAFDLGQVEGKSCCPYCGAAGDGWKTIKTAEIQSALAGLGTKRAQLVEHLNKLRVDHIDIVRQYEEAKDAVNSRREIEVQIGNLNKAITLEKNALAVIEAKEEELATLPGADSQAASEMEKIKSSLNVANERMRAVDSVRQTAMGRAGELRRLSEAETNRDKAKAEEAAAKKAIEALKTIQGQMVQDAFVPLLETANSFFGSILKTPLAYNPDNCEIGTWRSGVWVGHTTFSGTEKALCYAAIQAALAAQSPIRIMLLDELGRLDAGNVAKLLCAIDDRIQAGTINQFVGIDATNRYEISSASTQMPWQIIAVK